MLDKEMREPLFDFLDDYYGKIRTMEEKIIMTSRADVLGITDGQILGFEIKSDSDTYARLESQIKDYDKFCNKCFVVVGKSHLAHVHEHIPEHWGIICIEDDPESPEKNVFIARDPGVNKKVRLKYQIKLMWRRELNQLLALNELPRYPQKSKAFVQEALLTRVDNELLMRQMTDLIFERDYTIFDTENAEPVGFRKNKKGVRVSKTIAKRRAKRKTAKK